MGPDPQRMVGRLRARQRADGQHSRPLGIVLVVALLYGGFALLRMRVPLRPRRGRPRRAGPVASIAALAHAALITRFPEVPGLLG
jgi:hypothetical protein